jgi:hypothetical protein
VGSLPAEVVKGLCSAADQFHVRLRGYSAFPGTSNELKITLYGLIWTSVISSA